MDFPLAAIPQTGRKPRIIYNFSRSGLNEIAKSADHKDTMSFRKALNRLLYFILATDPALGPTYLHMVYLTDAYMQIWVRL